MIERSSIYEKQRQFDSRSLKRLGKTLMKTSCSCQLTSHSTILDSRRPLSTCQDIEFNELCSLVETSSQLIWR